MRTPPPPSLPPGSEVGGYVLDERIGAGGFGEVYRAHHPVIGSVVAIKLLHARYSHDPEAVARFVDEARAVNRITHPGIVQVFDFGRAHDREYFVMELIEGRSLRAILDERGKLPLVEAVPILAGIARAVDAAHAAGIAHRDLKPENVFVLADGRTKLIDFGLAKLTRDAEPVTESGSVFGTPLYMSPEQCRGRGVDTRTDIYSFGALAYHVLTGAPPFIGEPIELALHHVNDPPPPPRVSRTVDRVLLALLAKDPAARPASLGAAIGALSGSARLPIRWRFVVVPLVAAALAAVTVAYVATRSSSTVDRTAFWTAKRDALSRRFGTHSDWPDAVAALDGATARWAAQWARAQTLDEEPLLHAQRIACLETILLDIESTVAVLDGLDLAVFESWNWEAASETGGRSLSDCDNPAVLRAQVPPPPAGVRAQVVAKQRLVQRAITNGYVGFVRRDLAAIDREAATLAQLARELEALHPPSAGNALLARVKLLADAAKDNDVRRFTGVRAARDEAVQRLAANRDDIGLAQAHLAIAEETRAPADVERAAQTIERAGRPARAVLRLAMLRGDLALRNGDPAAAVAAFREALAIANAEDLDTIGIEHGVIAALLRNERLDDARAEAERFLRAGGHPQRHLHVSFPAQLAGDMKTALTEQRAFSTAMAARPSQPEKRNAWGRLYEVDLALQAGETPPDTAEAIRAIAGLGTTPPLQNPDGIATARRAGLYAAYTRGIALGLGDELALLDHKATRAFHRGDDFVPLAKQAAARCGCTEWMPLSRWLALAHEPDLGPKLRALETAYGDSPFAIAYSGILLAHLGHWTEARAKLEAARAADGVWENQADLADLATWLGLARLQAGDRAGARSAFEEALDVISVYHNGPDGFSYTTPRAQQALADLVDDPIRAAGLRRRALAGFERLRR